MIQGRDLSENPTDLLSGEHDREFELRIGADPLDFGRPGATECLFPEQLDGADRLGGGLPGELLLGFEVKEVTAEFLGGDEVGRAAVKLAQLAHAGPVAQDGAFGQREQAQVVEEAI